MLSLLIGLLIIVVIFGIIAYVIQQLPGVPPFASAIVWLIALLVILAYVADHAGLLNGIG